MRAGYPEGWIFLGLLFLETVAPPRANSRNVSAIAKSGAQAQPVQGSVIFADQQFGSDMGAKIVAANTALGPAKGEIRVAKSGEISEPVLLSHNHSLTCVGDQVTLTLSSSRATIIQESDTHVRGCTLSSSQTLPPAGGAEIVSQGTSNVQVDDVTFVGGGDHIEFNNVSNFSIGNTRHVSITAKGASPILIDSSTRGHIISPRIDGFTVPAGDSSIRLIGINKSSLIEVSDPAIKDVDASTVPGCGGVSFTASSNSALHGGVVSGLNNCDGVLTESTDRAASSDIEISGTVSMGHNTSAGSGKNANNGEGFDIFNSKRVQLSEVTARNNGKSPSNRQPGIEVSNSSDVSISKGIASDNGLEGIRVDGSPGVTISASHTNRNGGGGIVVMPALGRVRVTEGSPIVDWTPGDANMTFSAVWPPRSKIVIAGAVYRIASLQSTTRLMLTADVSAATGNYAYNVDSYVEITGGESLDNGQLSLGLPPDRNVGRREGVYFAGGFSGEVTGRVTRLQATDTQNRKTQTFGIRVENRARIVADDNSVDGNLAGGIQDSPGKSTIR
ncbi:MAG: right-handed parallel beta-helix repeat-containing protein [Candidatus Sulfotelmatobacter sp.]